MQLYDTTLPIDGRQQPMFLGKGKGLQRYDNMKYPVFDNVAESMLEDFWKKQEVKLLTDKGDHDNALPSIRRVFSLNIKRQSVMDTIQGRSLLATIGRVITNPELEKAITILQQQEVNHSDTYTYILRNIYSNPSQVFDEINSDKVITAHADKIKDVYEKLYELLAKWEYEQTTKVKNPAMYNVMKYTSFITGSKLVTEYELKKEIYLAIVAWNIIEGIRFFVSFACTFKMGDNRIYTGNAQELKLIARDELNHLKISQNLLRYLNKNEGEGFAQIAVDCKDEVENMFREAVKDECEWAHYLFEEGNLLGLNAVILIRYMKHLANIRNRAIGGGRLYPQDECEDLTFMNKWLGGERVQELLQEMDPTQYKIGMTIPVSDNEWDSILTNYIIHL